MANRNQGRGKKKDILGPVETAADIGCRLNHWAVTEMGYHPWGRYSTSQMPTASEFKEVCCGPMVDVWKFVLSHAHSLQTVRKVKGNLEFHSQLAVPAYKVRYQASNVFSAECAQLQSERHELGQRLAALLATTAQTETELDTQRQELQRAESKCQELTSMVHDLQRRSTLLLIRSRTVHVDLSQYAEYAHRLADHTKQLAALAQQPVGESVYSKQEETCHAGGDYLETLCMKDVRETCEHIGNFLQELLQGSFSSSNKLISKRRAALWQTVEQVLFKHSSKQILTSLCINAQDSVLRLRSKTAQIAIHQDIDMLKFKHETNGQLLDTSVEPSLLQSVQQLLEEGQQAHTHRFLETEQSKNTAWHLKERLSRAKVHLDAILGKRYIRDAAALQMARHLLEVDMKTSALRASLQCLELAADVVKGNISLALREEQIVLAKYQKIQDFGKLACTKQNAIRALVKQNLASQSKLELHQTEVLKYVERTVCRDSKVTAQLSKQLRDGVIMEVNAFSADHRPMPIFSRVDSTYKSQTTDLSINRFHGNQSGTTGQYLERVLTGVDFARHQAPECLLMRVMERLNEVDELQLFVDNCGKVAMDTGRGSSDVLLRHMKDVRHQVAVHSKKQLETILPLIEKRVSRTPKALSACLQLQDTAAKWWEQPAQHCAVGRTVDNMTLQQWTDKWTVAVTQLRQLSLRH